MSSSRSPSPPPAQSRRGSVNQTPNDTPKRYMNGWSKEQDNLMADWSDIAGCYRWMHDRAEKKYTVKNMYMTIPVIILSTLTGTASVGIGSIAGNDEQVQKYLNFGIGGLSLIAGILTTLNNFLRFAQLGESNRVAGIAWGKFQRLISVELALHPNDRMDSLDFLKICRADLDRLIEQSPPIPDSIIAEFEVEFKDKPKLRRPDICHGLDHTHVFDNTQSRLKDLTSEAALMLMHKKKMMRQEILPDLDRMIANAVNDSMIKKRQELESLVKSSNIKDPLSLYKAAEVDFKVLLEQRKKALESTNVMGLTKNVVNTEVFEFSNPLRGMTVSSGNTMLSLSEEPVQEEVVKPPVKHRIIVPSDDEVAVTVPENIVVVEQKEEDKTEEKKIETEAEAV